MALPTIPTALPDFATDDDYGAGTDDWSGQPNKVKPTSGIISEGLLPQAYLQAEYLNWGFGNHGQWIKILNAYSLKQDWRNISSYNAGLGTSGKLVEADNGPIDPKLGYQGWSTYCVAGASSGTVGGLQIGGDTGINSLGQVSADYSSPAIVMEGAKQGATASIYTTEYQFYPTSTSVFICEFDVGMDPSTTGATHDYQFYVGIGQVTTGIPNVSHAYFLRDANNVSNPSHWRTSTRSSGSAEIQDTGVAPGSHSPGYPFERLRIEYWGSATALAQSQVRFFVNGVLKTTHVTEVPNDRSQIVVALYSDVAATNANDGYYLGRIAAIWGETSAIGLTGV